MESEIWKASVEAVLANSEFSLLDVSSDTLREKLETQRASIEGLVSEEQNTVLDGIAQEEAAKARLDHHKVFPWNLSLWSVLAAAAALLIWHPTWWVPLIALGLFSVAAYRFYRFRFDQKERELHSTYAGLLAATRSNQEKLRVAVSRAMMEEMRTLTASLKVQAWREDDLRISSPSGLVEADASELHLDVKVQGKIGRFILGHATGAIGIAGPRGVGKTTLLRYPVDHPPTQPQSRGRGFIRIWRFLPPLSDRRRRDPLCCFVSAPVRYDFRDFLLHLYATVCRTVLPVDARTSPMRTHRRSLHPVVVAAGALALTSALLIIFSTVPWPIGHVALA